MTLHTAFQLAGIAHLISLSAIIAAPRQLNWDAELSRLPRLLHQMCNAYHYYTSATIVACGLLSLFLADELAKPSGLSRALCAYIALFWTARFVLQFTYDARPHLRGFFLRAGYHALSVLFLLFMALYGWAAIRDL